MVCLSFIRGTFFFHEHFTALYRLLTFLLKFLVLTNLFCYKCGLFFYYIFQLFGVAKHYWFFVYFFYTCLLQIHVTYTYINCILILYNYFTTFFSFLLKVFFFLYVLLFCHEFLWFSTYIITCSANTENLTSSFTNFMRLVDFSCLTHGLICRTQCWGVVVVVDAFVLRRL